MAKVKDGQDSLINREQYSAVKRMDRVEIETFLKYIYDKGFSKGRKSAECAAAETAAGKRGEIVNELLEFVGIISGIGPATLKKINDAIRKEYGGE